VHLGSYFVGGIRKCAVKLWECHWRLLRQKNKLKLKTTKQSRPNPKTLTWNVIKSNSTKAYYLFLTGFLYCGKRCKIDMKKDKHEEPTVLYGTSLLLTFLADIYEQYFQTRFVDWIIRTCCLCWWAQSQNQIILSNIPSSEPFRIGLFECYWKML